MKKLLVNCILVFASISFSGCLRTYYPVSSLNSAPPMATKLDYSNDNNSDFLSTSATFGNAEYEEETFNSLKLSYIFVNTGNHYNFNIEGFGQGGFYNVVGLSEKFDGKKSFYGFGANASVLVNFKLEKFKLGIGTNLGVGIELGEFYDFRKQAQKENMISESDNLIYPMVSVFPYLSYQLSECNSISSQINIGAPGFVNPIVQFNNEYFSVWVNWLPYKFQWDKVTTERISVGVMLNIGSSGLIF